MARIAGVDLPQREADRNWTDLYLRYRKKVRKRHPGSNRC